jgi:hypothetical protein
MPRCGGSWGLLLLRSYGETEMRRLDRDTPFGERVLLHAYWPVPGYGLRASRALAALGAAMFLTVVLTMLWGLSRPGMGPVGGRGVSGCSQRHCEGLPR